MTKFLCKNIEKTNNKQHYLFHYFSANTGFAKTVCYRTQKKRSLLDFSYLQLRRPDSNRRPLGYEPNELPTAPLRDVHIFLVAEA